MNIKKDIDPNFQSGYVAIIGLPNAGKSTLMNSLLKEKLAIVTPKPQTTRHRILGILNDKLYQLILLDTPGLLEPGYLMQEKMMEISRSVIQDADVVLALLDATRPDSATPLLDILKTVDTPKILVLNKSDLLQKEWTVEEIKEKTTAFSCRDGLVISAKTGESLDVLVSMVLKYIPRGFPFYPSDQLSDEPERFFVSEIIREQVFMKYGEEIPYATAVQIVEFKEREKRKDFIHAVITVERDSQKAILIGKGGKALKQVGTEARHEIEHFLNRSVFLQLDVRVRKKWRKNPQILKQMGFK